MSKKQVIAFIGVAFLIAGVFLPIYSIPLIGDITLIKANETNSILILLAALISVGVVLSKYFIVLWGTGVGTLCISIYSFVKVYIKLHEVSSFFGELSTDIVKYKLGFPVLIAGAILIIVSAAIKENNKKVAE